jgi:hypothetical protein
MMVKPSYNNYYQHVSSYLFHFSEKSNVVYHEQYNVL